MTTWPEFYFDSEFEAASEMPSMASQQMELAEAYSTATRAIHTHRTSFLTLKPQSQRTHLVATAKELAKLVSAKNRAYYRLNSATAPDPAACQPQIVVQVQPPVGIQSQPPVANGVQVQPDKRLPPKSGIQTRPPSTGGKMLCQSQPHNGEQKQPLMQPLDRRKSQPPKIVQPPAQPARKQPLKVGVQSQPRPRGQPPDLPPDPETRVSKEDWGKGSFDPG